MGWAQRTCYVLALVSGTAAVLTCTQMNNNNPPSSQPGTSSGPASTRSGSQPAGRGGGAGGAGRGGAFGGGAGGFGGGAGGRGRGGANRPDFIFLDSSYTLDERLDDLLARMTLEEKASQMLMDAPAIQRLSIASYHWWNEALHGVGRNGEATVFPQAIGMAASWDPDLHKRMAKVIADEGRAKHAEATRGGNGSRQYAGLDFWSPNINIFRDPRWGRGQETYGEDPYLTSRLGIAFVTGLQGNDPYYFQTIATPKHYAVHSGPEMERHRFNAEPSEVDLFTTYLPAFEATVREAKAFSVMAAYNSVNGVPATASPRLLNDILRTTWGFQGYVTSDVDSVSDVFLSHGLVESPEAAAAASVKAGCDLNGGTTYRALAEAVRQGLLTEADINKSLRRLFAARFRLGEFDATPPADSDIPRNPYANIPASANDTREHDAIAQKMARESMVLLKNANNALPLRKDIKSIAVIGPTANSVQALYGNYNGTASRPVTILQGIRNAVPLTTQVLYLPGSPIVTEEVPLAEAVPAACFFTDDTCKNHGLMGTYFRSVFSTDRPIRTRIDDAPDLSYPDQSSRDPLTYSDGFYVKWTGVLVAPATGDYQIGFVGKDSFRLAVDGKMVVDEWYSGNRRTIGEPLHMEKDKVYNIVAEYAHPASAGGGGGQATLPANNRDTAFVQLAWTRPTPDGLPAAASGLPLYNDAVSAARTADAVVLVLGITAELEKEEGAIHNVGFSGGDRTSLDLPIVQERLLEQVTAAAGNKPVVLVLTSGSAMSVNWASEHVPAILQAWYPGQHGDAVADVLFGTYNPGGRLPVTFYKSVNDLPAFTSYAMQDGNGRTYRYFKGTPLYPFGYGLSYTKFEYAGLKVTENPSTTQDIVASVTVKNTGSMEGDEVVQVYVENPPVVAGGPLGNPPIALTTQMSFSAAAPEVKSALENLAKGALPPKQLVGFQRVTLKPGQSKTVEFTITAHQLAAAFSEKKRLNVARAITLQVAPNSANGSGLSQKLSITGPTTEVDYRFMPAKVSDAASAQP